MDAYTLDGQLNAEYSEVDDFNSTGYNQITILRGAQKPLRRPRARFSKGALGY